MAKYEPPKKSAWDLSLELHPDYGCIAKSEVQGWVYYQGGKVIITREGEETSIDKFIAERFVGRHVRILVVDTKVDKE
jgi:hypothetical protein